MSRRPYKKRTWIAECKRCGRWYSVATLEEQKQAKAKGTCMECEEKRQYRIGLYKNLLKQHMVLLAEKAGKLPEAERGIYRQLYRKRQRQWRWCVEQLEPAEVAA